jgi:hypothetical protein
VSDGPVTNVYCDESHDHDGPRYMVYGGMIISSTDLQEFAGRMQSWRIDTKMHAELKWSKITEQRLPQYESLVDLFCEFSKRDILHFKAVVFDKQAIDYRAFHGGCKLRGRYTFFYHFLLHKFGCYATTDDHRLRIIFDDTTNRYPLSDFRRILNSGICKKYGRKGQIVRSVEPIDSKKSDLIQMADVLMGAVGFHCNGIRVSSKACKARMQLANSIATKCELKNLSGAA